MVLETAKRLVMRGHQVDCVCIRADTSIVGVDTGIVFHEIGGPLSSEIQFWLRFRLGCSRVAEVVKQVVAGDRLGNCILFPQVFPANWWGSFVMKQLPELRCVWYCQEPSAFIHSKKWINALPWPKNWIAQGLRPILRQWDLHYCKVFSNVLVNSQFSRRYAQDVYGYSDKHCEVVYLGLDSDRFKSDATVEREPWITCVAKLTRFKNVDKIISAVELLVDAGNAGVQLHIVGTGNAQVELQKLTIRLGLEQRVTFHGRLSDTDMVRLLQGSRGLCLASVDEPFGLVAVEALACGTPVIAVNSGGPAEIIGQSQAGLLIERPDSQSIANAIKTLIDEPLMFSRRSKAALTRSTEFDWERTVDRLEAIFLHELNKA